MEYVILNQTPLSARLEPYRDLTGRPHVLVIAKATWRLDTGRLMPAEQQVALNLQPLRKPLGELALDEIQLRAIGDRKHLDIVWLDHDLSPPKPAFDVLIAGHVTAPPNHSGPSVRAEVRIGRHKATVEAHVPRYWKSGLLGYSSAPLAENARRIPITYAVADWSAGFPLERGNDKIQLLPWLKQPGASSSRTRHASHPAGFGFWPENAAHRHCHAGTYDDRWRRERMPDLPQDFDARFYNTAHPDLQLPNAPSPDTAIRLVHLAAVPVLSTRMPDLPLAVQTTTASGSVQPAVAMKPDTLIIEPDQNRMSVVFRALLPTADGADAPRSIRLFNTGVRGA
jgi:hypothetical protein